MPQPPANSSNHSNLSAANRRRIFRALLAAGVAVVLVIVGSLALLAATHSARAAVNEALNEEIAQARRAQDSAVSNRLTELRRATEVRRGRVRRLVLTTTVLQVVGLLAVLILLYYVYRRLLPLTRNLASSLEEKDEAIDRHESTEIARELLIATLMTKNKELDHFAYLASHDLQEPLRTITNFIEIIEEDFAPQLGEEGRVYLDFINEATGRMQRMITTLLRFSQLGRSGERETVELNQVLLHAKADLTAAINESGGTITYDPLPSVWGYETELHQLFLNLLSNALKFVARGEKPVVHVSCAVTEDYHVVSVTDQGIGLDEVAQTKVFQMFNRVNKPTAYEGYGIGLAFCRKIVELHGGTLSVESAPGRGSTFYFTLPHYLVDDDHQTEPYSADR